MCENVEVTKLVDGINTVLKCNDCGKTIVVNIPIFNTEVGANDAVFQAIVDNNWLASGDDDTLLCAGCRS